MTNNSTTIITNYTFQKNSGTTGSFHVDKSILSFGENIFQSNSAIRGGILCVKNSTLTLTKNTFRDNFASFGGVLYVLRDVILTRNTFHSNSAISGGFCCANVDNILILSENTFQNNSAASGGVCYITNSVLALRANTFQNNTANYGGALDENRRFQPNPPTPSHKPKKLNLLRIQRIQTQNSIWERNRLPAKAIPIKKFPAKENVKCCFDKQCLTCHRLVHTSTL